MRSFSSKKYLGRPDLSAKPTNTPKLSLYPITVPFLTFTYNVLSNDSLTGIYSPICLRAKSIDLDIILLFIVFHLSNIP